MYTNRNSKKDFVINGFNELSTPSCQTSIAVAFFTDVKPLKEIVGHGCTVRLIVRLGHPTSSTALRECLGLNNCLVRYVTDHSFHPKIYIFGENGAIVGSANLTGAAFWTNQEVSLKLESDDPRFDELKILFEEYWSQSKVLTEDILTKYDNMMKPYEKFFANKSKELEQEIKAGIGAVGIENIVREKKKKTKKELFIDDYQKSYQETVSAFRQLKEIYCNAGERRVSENVLPLRLEIDSFISHARHDFVPGDSYKDRPLLDFQQQVKEITPMVKEWLPMDYKWLDEHIIPENYPRIKKVFTSSQTLLSSSDQDLYSALRVCHAFENQLRFFKGGSPAQEKAFFNDNDMDEVRQILNYLVFGNEDVVIRMANCIFNYDYGISHFGRSCVQELIGWVGNQDLPVINGRTTKVLRYFGFNIRQIA